LASLLVQKYCKRTDCSKMTPLGKTKTTPTPWPSLQAKPSKNNF
jgi:hypothetical protein